MYRPLSAEDFESAFHRMKAGDPMYECYVPVREDAQLTNGDILHGLLSWGHEKAYKLIRANGEVYAVRQWEESPELGPRV